VPRWRSSLRQGARSTRNDRAKEQRGPSHTPPCAISKKGVVVYGSYVDEPLAIIAGSGGPTNTNYLHSNRVYSVAAMTDNAGTVVERYRYDAMGQQTVLAPDSVTSRLASSYANQIGFTGRFLDQETGLWYFRSRMYSGALGRFIGRDPIAYLGGGYDLYLAYFVPTSLDPFGLDPYPGAPQVCYGPPRGCGNTRSKHFCMRFFAFAERATVFCR
jgi:RHS repeat-associated protein